MSMTDAALHAWMNGVFAFLLGCLGFAAFFATMGLIFLIVNFVDIPREKEKEKLMDTDKIGHSE